MARDEEKQSMNPYHYIQQCIGGKWKMTILHEIDTFGSIRFNYAVRVLPLSEKVLSQQLKELIENMGGKAAGSVSSKTDYLINNDNTSGSSKNKKAKELNIPIITEEEFLEMINNA